ncbi:MAG: hypothetical protein IT294_05230 [Deltaproteobacteria bacterium]|nr:hypothetical protein [Deltaproteobacteria bacterium]
MSRRPLAPIATLQPPVWGGAAPASAAAALLDAFQAWRRQYLRALRLGDEIAAKRARAGLGGARAAAAEILARPRFRRAWAAIEYTEAFLMEERASEDEAHHDPTLCYLCDPGATLGLSLPRAIGYATASFFQIENGAQVDEDFFADWDELRRARGVRIVPIADVPASPEAYDDLLAFLAWELEGVCRDYVLPHVRRWQTLALEAFDLDRLMADLTIEARRYWLVGNTFRNGFSSTRL